MDIEETASNKKRGGIPPEEREGKRLRPTEEIELPSQLRANVLECKLLIKLVHVICSSLWSFVYCVFSYTVSYTAY